MARTRSIKPGFFKNEVLCSLPYQDRLLFAGLWTIADREGRLEDRPRRIQADIFPYDHDFDIEGGLVRLQESKFIKRYQVNENKYICIPAFNKHQSPHFKEQASVIQAPGLPEVSPVLAAPSTLPPVLPSTLPPDKPEPDMSPALDEQFQEYRRLFEIVGNPIPEDFANGSFCWRAWCKLDYNQRATAIESLAERERAGATVLNHPDTYLTKGAYQRKLLARANGNGKRDIAAEMLAELREKNA